MLLNWLFETAGMFVYTTFCSRLFDVACNTPNIILVCKCKYFIALNRLKTNIDYSI